MYLRDVRRHSLMSRDEELELARRFRETGDAWCAVRLVDANLRLVVKIARSYRASRRDLTDLIQEGNLGLIHAVQKYDPERGVKLSTYAGWWIRAYMLKFMISNARLVKIATTRAQRRLFFGLRRAQAQLEGQTGAQVGSRQIAASLAVPEREVVEMDKRLSSSDASIDRPSRDGDDRPRIDTMIAETLGPDEALETYEFHDVVRRELEVFGRTLTGRDALIFRQRMVSEEPVTLAIVAEQFGVTRERARQLESRVKERLRDHLRATLGDAVPAAA